MLLFQKNHHWWWLLVGTIILVAAFFIPVLAVVAIVSGIILFIWILSYYIEAGWLVLVALSPLIQWELSLGWLQSVMPEYPWVYGMHAPVVEWWAVALIVAVAWRIIRQARAGETLTVMWPGFQWFLLFAASAFLSLINVPPGERLDAVKYIFHFIFLFYVGYVVVGTTVVNTKRLWRKSLMVLAAMGFAAALMGAASIVVGLVVGDGFHRAVPLALFGWAPFGDQHIFLAEVITTTLPIFFYFWHNAKKAEQRTILSVTVAFVLLVGFLTLSRAGWITMGLEAIIFSYLTRRLSYWREAWRTWRFLAAPVALVFVYLIYFLLTSPAAQSSTSTRLYLTDMALYLFREHPVVGFGAGTFPNRVAEIKIFTSEFGERLDAQGIGQKLLAEQGLLGLITFAVLVGWIVVTIVWRYRDKDYTAEARGAYGVSLFLVLSPLIFQLFNTQYYTSKMWVPITLALAQSLLYKKDTEFVKLQINLKDKKKVVTEI